MTSRRVYPDAVIAQPRRWDFRAASSRLVVARDQPARSAQRRRRSGGDASLLEDVMRELEVFEQVRPPCLAIVACAKNGGGMNGNEGRKPVSDLQRSAT